MATAAGSCLSCIPEVKRSFFFQYFGETYEVRTAEKKGVQFLFFRYVSKCIVVTTPDSDSLCTERGYYYDYDGDPLYILIIKEDFWAPMDSLIWMQK